MARETKALNGVTDLLRELQGVRVYDVITVDKWDTLQFNYVGILHCEDSRELEPLEDNSAMVNMGQLEIYLLVGAQVKKSATNKLNVRDALANICEQVEYKLHNVVLPSYVSDYEAAEFAPLHYVSSQALQYNEDNTKGLSIMVFRTKYIRSN
jgi:hypothetical protein